MLKQCVQLTLQVDLDLLAKFNFILRRLSIFLSGELELPSRKYSIPPANVPTFSLMLVRRIW